MHKKAIEKTKWAGGRCRDGILWSLGRLWHSFIFVITREKIIQGGISATFFGIILALSEGFGIYLSDAFNAITGLFVPAKFMMVPLLIVALGAFLWADANTDEWREIIAETTGEEEAVEKAEKADEEEQSGATDEADGQPSEKK